VIAYVWFIVTGLLIGIPPMQFPLLVLTLRLVESLSHANTRLRFGWVGERILVSPQFHRAHHGLLAAGQQSFNYGSVFPWWDMIFRTAQFRHDVIETGDAGASEALVSGSWWEQQKAGLARAIRLASRRRSVSPSV
jgi:sterol desaturase/sphingolipid hydroxylase (fatty acid hydroxylase superfamily)